MDDETLRKLMELISGIEKRAQADHRTAENSPEFYQGRASGYGHAARLFTEAFADELKRAPVTEDPASA